MLAVEICGEMCSNQPVEKDVFIGLGTNQGDRELNLLLAVAEVGKLQESRITSLSSFYDTEPVGPVEQEPFLNAALRLETSLEPAELLAELQRIETEVFRRIRDIPGGPRPIDLDILCYGNRELNESELTVPHPHMHERRFVLVPMAEIAPDFVHPVQKAKIATLLRRVKTGERVTKI